MQFTVSEAGKPGSTSHSMPCITCDGAGAVTPRAAERHHAEVAMWCSCGNPSCQSDYYPDGAHPEIYKHHYRCSDCGKVTQVG